ncbi:MAG: hypothetical protein ABIG03_07960 [Candidatus Eisenbacteria bacterium]
MYRKLLAVAVLVALVPCTSPARTPDASDVRPDYRVRAQRGQRTPTIVFFDDMENGEGAWSHVDNTALSVPKFHLDTYYSYSRGYSWWCGEQNGLFAGGDGYGNNWDQILDLPSIDISSAVYPILEFAFRCDTEEDYDFAYVQAESGGVYVNLNRGFSGLHAWNAFSGYSVGPSTYDSPLEARFRFVSDPGFSDEDGGHDSDGGAFHVDNIRVYDYFDGSTLFLEDCESGGVCTPSVPAAAGDWWHIVSRKCISYSGANVWWCGDDGDTSLVPGRLNNVLVSPPIDVSGSMVCTLRFLLHAQVPTTDDDFWTEEITTDGGSTWHTTGVWWGDFGQCNAWGTHGINGVDVSPYLPGTMFRFRLTMHTTSNGCGPGATGGAGVALDDIWLEDWTGSAVRQTSWGAIKAMYR